MCVYAEVCVCVCTFSPLALFMALRGLSTLRTLRIFTTEMALDLHRTDTHTSKVKRICGNVPSHECLKWPEKQPMGRMKKKNCFEWNQIRTVWPSLSNQLTPFPWRAETRPPQAGPECWTSCGRRSPCAGRLRTRSSGGHTWRVRRGHKHTCQLQLTPSSMNQRLSASRTFYLEHNLNSEHSGKDDVCRSQDLHRIEMVLINIVTVCVCVFCVSERERERAWTLFLKDLGSIGSSAAREILLRRMKRRMKFVKGVALMILWHSLRNLGHTHAYKHTRTDAHTQTHTVIVTQ